jgi:hypothetical protein
MTAAGLRRCLSKPCTEEEGNPSNRGLPSPASNGHGRNIPTQTRGTGK